MELPNPSLIIGNPHKKVHCVIDWLVSDWFQTGFRRICLTPHAVCSVYILKGDAWWFLLWPLAFQGRQHKFGDEWVRENRFLHILAMIAFESSKQPGAVQVPGSLHAVRLSTNTWCTVQVRSLAGVCVKMYTKDPKRVVIAAHRFVFLAFAITTQMGIAYGIPIYRMAYGIPIYHFCFSSFGPWHSRASNA